MAKQATNGDSNRRRDGQLQRVLFALVVSAGWCVIGGGLVGSGLERTGLLAQWIETELQRHLGKQEAEVQVGSASIAWLDRTLVLREVTLNTGRPTEENSEEQPEVRLGEVRLVLGARAASGLRLAKVGLRGGHLRLTDELLSLAQRVSERLSGKQTGSLDLQRLPHMRVDHFQVSYGSGAGLVHLGRMGLMWQPDGEKTSIWGRIEPSGVNGASEALVLHGDLSPDLALDLRGRARDLALNESVLSAHTSLAQLSALNPSGLLSVDLHAHYLFGSDTIPSIDLRVHLRDGNLALSHVAPDLSEVEDINIQLRLASARGSERRADVLLALENWTGEVSLQARHQGHSFQSRARIGAAAGQDLAWDAWVHTPAVEFSPDTLALLGNPPGLINLYEMLAPDGALEVSYGVRAPIGWKPSTNPLRTTSNCAVVDSTGELSLAYVGGRNRLEGGQRNLGFPRRLTDVRGRATYAFVPGMTLAERTGFFDLSASAGEAGRAEVDGAIWVKPEWVKPNFDPTVIPDSEFSMDLRVSSLEVDEELREAFASITGIPAVSQLVDEYNPRGGAVDFTLRFLDPLGPRGLATDLDLSLEVDQLAWAPCPLPVEQARGKVQFRSNGQIDPELARAGVVFEVEGISSALRGDLRATGHFSFHGQRIEGAWARIDADGIELRSAALADALTVFSPGVLKTLKNTGAKGRVSLRTDFAKASIDGKQLAHTEISSSSKGLEIQLEGFPLPTEQLLGRILVRSEVPEQDPLHPGPPREGINHTRSTLFGSWLSGETAVPVAISTDQRVPEETTVNLDWARLDVKHPLVAGAIREAIAKANGQSGTSELSALDLAGHVDGAVQITLGPDPDAGPLTLELQANTHLSHLKLNDVTLLHNLRGKVSYNQEDESWVGERLTALLGDTPVELLDLTYGPTPEGDLLETGLRGLGLPFDEDHLRNFLDEDLMRTLLDQLDLAGVFDVEDSRLSVLVRHSGQTSLTFDGDLAIRDARMNLGVPVTVEVARGVHLSLGYEGGRVRALAQVRQARGTVAGRSLEKASWQATYVEPRLTIEEFGGDFEGGTLRSLGANATGPAGFFSLDLVEPFAFNLSTEMIGVDAGRLLAGLFNSDFANEGTLDAELRLSGAVDDLAQTQGGGKIQLRDSALWAIPVFQSLFSQLGFKTTATFSRMESHFDINEGRLDMSRMRMKSDLLSLVGDGWIDFDGTMSHDLRVRYSIVDRLGPFTQLLYWIQNGLLRVAIRGDMSRPEVILKGLFSQFFKTPSGGRRLPLPSLSPLPKRF